MTDQPTTEPFVLTVDQALADLREIVAADPDFVWTKRYGAESCAYFLGDQPACLVGKVIAKHGATSSTFTDGPDTNPGSNTAVFNANYVLAALPFDVEPDAVDLLTRVQNRQDSGYSWALALEDGERLVRTLTDPTRTKEA